MRGLEKVLVLCGASLGGVFQEKVNAHAQTGKRGAEFVRGGHDEFTLELLHFLQAGDIPEQEHDAGKIPVPSANSRNGKQVKIYLHLYPEER